jgi:peptidoglycan/xylan/chitin deacetylase (PgdA/CDA1 family)
LQALIQTMERVLNLTFHGIGTPERELEPGEADVWVSRERFEALIERAAALGGVRITFDDGNRSDLEHALPALSRHSLSGTFFVVAGRLGEPDFLDRDDVRTLRDAGMTIGCHGMHHRPWRTLDDAELERELVDARAVLEEVVGGPVTQAACPFGSYNRRVLRALRRSGYSEVHTSDRGLARPGDWMQTRNTVHAGDDGGMLDRILLAAGSRPRALRHRARLAAKRLR